MSQMYICYICDYEASNYTTMYIFGETRYTASSSMLKNTIA